MYTKLFSRSLQLSLRIVITKEVRGYTINRSRHRREKRNLKTGLLAAGCAVGAMILLGGCGMSSASLKESSATVQESDHRGHLSEVPPASIVNVTSGLADMTSKIKLYKQAIESDDVDAAKQLVDDIASLWIAIDPKLDDPDDTTYSGIEDDVAAILGGTSVEPWDKEMLIQLAYKLYQALRDVTYTVES